MKLSDRIAEAAYRNRVVFRAFGDNILGFAPALCHGANDFDLLFDRSTKTLNEVFDLPEVRRTVRKCPVPEKS